MTSFLKHIRLFCLLICFSMVCSAQQKPAIDSLDIKIGQLIIFGFYGQTANPKDPVYRAVKEGKVGSILLYRRNISATNTRAKLKSLVDGFQAVAPIPLFISIDQEGGRVNRFDSLPGFPLMPSARFLGLKNDTAITAEYTRNITKTLNECAINLNYTPVLDLHNPQCPVLGARNRCFAADPAIVTLHATQVIKTHNEAGIHTIVKHFPGHGNSASDSHLGVVDVTKTWKKEELEPYRQLIEAGHLQAVMTAHIVNRNLDPSGRPATLSRLVITGLLRDSLGFTGPVFSDDMQMQAISSHYGLEESIRLALEAGVDVLMFSNNIRGVASYSPQNIHNIIKSLVIKGKISETQINASYNRVMEMKKKWQ